MIKINDGDQPATRQFIVDVAQAVISALSPDYVGSIHDFEDFLKKIETEEEYQRVLKEQGCEDPSS